MAPSFGPGVPPAEKWLGRLARVLVAVFVGALVVRLFGLEPFVNGSGSMAPTLLPGDVVLVNKIAYGLRIPLLGRWPVRPAVSSRGDVIVFRDPHDLEKNLVKRIVGFPGDKIEMREQIVYVNDVPQPRTERGVDGHDDLLEGSARWSSEDCQVYSEQLAKGAVLPPASEEAADLVASYRAAALGGVSEHRLLQCEKAGPGDRQGPFSVMAGNIFVLGDNRDRSYDSRSEKGWQVPIENIEGKVTFILWSWGRGGRTPFGGEGLRVERLGRRVE